MKALRLTRKDTSFENTQEHTANDQAGVRFDKSLTHGDDSPAKHQSTQPHARADSLHEQITGDFQKNVWYKENHGGNVVLSSAHVKFRCETLDLCISDVDSVKKGKHIQDEEDRKEVKVDLPYQPIFLGGIDIGMAIVALSRWSNWGLLVNKGAYLLRVDLAIRRGCR